MGKGVYIGVSSVARKVKRAYIGVGDVAKKIKKMYIGDANGVARLFYSGNAFRFLYTSANQVDNEYKVYSSIVKPPTTFTSATSPADRVGNLVYDKANERFILVNAITSSQKPYFYTMPEDGSTWTYIGQPSTSAPNGVSASIPLTLNSNGTISGTNSEFISGSKYRYCGLYFTVTDTATYTGRVYFYEQARNNMTQIKEVNGYYVGMRDYSSGVYMDYVPTNSSSTTHVDLETASSQSSRGSTCIMGAYNGCPIHYANGVYSVTWGYWNSSYYYIKTRRASTMAGLASATTTSFSVSSMGAASMSFIYDDKLVFILRSASGGTYINSAGVWVMDLSVLTPTAPTKVSTWYPSVGAASSITNVVEDGENIYITIGSNMYYSPNLSTWTAISLDTTPFSMACTKVDT